MTPPRAEIRPAAPGDLPALARLIAEGNARPGGAGQCLHCAETTSAGARGALREGFGSADGWAAAFTVAARQDADGFTQLAGALGCQLDAAGTLGWLWGPWVAREADWQALGPTLLDRLPTRLPRTVRRLDAFLHAGNRPGLRLLQAHGFTLRQETHIYVAPRGVWTDHGGEESVTALRAAHEIAFARLHAETFPTGGESARAEDLLAGRDEEHRIFALADGLRLLGYVCASVNHAPREGFVDYLAVRSNARGRGVGGQLLHAALRWIFTEQRLPQAALCVSDWRSGARRLYEQAGFALQASGVGARRWLR